MTVTVTKPQLNLREELSTLKKPSGIIGEQILRADSSDDFYRVVGTNRNLLINGDFRFWQRGNSYTFNNYGADRWVWVGGSNTGTIVPETSDVPPGFTSAVRMTNNGTGTMILRQIVENARNLYGTKGITRTLSAWVKVVNGSFSIDISDKADVYTVRRGQWHRITTTTSLDDGNAYGANAYIDLQLNGVGEVIVTGVQYEVSTCATPYEYRPNTIEAALCYRYFYKLDLNTTQTFGYGHKQTTNILRATTVVPVQFRTTPSVITSGYFYASAVGGDVAITAMSVLAITGNTVIIEYTAPNVGSTPINVYAYSGYMALSAEL